MQAMGITIGEVDALADLAMTYGQKYSATTSVNSVTVCGQTGL